MNELGSYPSLVPGLGTSDEAEISLLSPEELAEAQEILDNGSEAAYDELIEGLSLQLAQARNTDSLHATLASYSSGKLLDALDAEADRQDLLHPELAPHAVILGPRFPRDNRHRSIRSKVLGVTGGKVSDSFGVFGDPYWGGTLPRNRLQGRRLLMTSGPQKGESYLITLHEYDDPAYVRLEGDPLDGGDAGAKFEIDGEGLPDDSFLRSDRGGDWMIVTALHGTLTAVNVGLKKITCAAVFNATGYWLVDGVKIPGNLAGRPIKIEGDGEFLIESHDPATGTVILDGIAGVSGNERFWIKARSPAETGKQESGLLADAGPIEPSASVRISPRSLAQADPQTAADASAAMKGINRYMHLRFHRIYGSRTQLGYLQRTSFDAIRQYGHLRERAADIRAMSEDLNLPLVFSPPEA